MHQFVQRHRLEIDQAGGDAIAVVVVKGEVRTEGDLRIAGVREHHTSNPSAFAFAEVRNSHSTEPGRYRRRELHRGRQGSHDRIVDGFISMASATIWLRMRGVVPGE